MIEVIVFGMMIFYGVLTEIRVNWGNKVISTGGVTDGIGINEVTLTDDLVPKDQVTRV
jgi:hypothetical protein